MKHDDDSSNPSNNTPFEDILTAEISRRSVLTGGLAAAAAGFLGSFGTSALADDHGKGWRVKKGKGGQLIGFEPVKYRNRNTGYAVIDGQSFGKGRVGFI